ncbi:GDSL-type esterase/lipase family protein [Modestobacter sp. VKM Ac-2977]|uniref:GDSL-type esterase/lipase family protein n=1 Tax=Modestobacter sp. VKM Ac-2977 TaxID=3004131 RepID=UPI0022AA43F5|nr:GDSL-type esterase/lipase family protein [Modestobacter sp. VKM Ac-2977]MCZ2820744.1 GDSL-type esterase/lipase family protein [Modestobacter sp. VKM Ac-2977]
MHARVATPPRPELERLSRDVVIASPDVRVCVFGDSFTAGVGDRTGAGWVGQVTAAAQDPRWSLTAYNLGVRRDTSVDIARRWSGEARSRLKDGDRFGIVLAFGTNDVDEQEGRRRVPRERTLDLLGQMLNDAHTAGWASLVVGPPPVLDTALSARAGALAVGMAATCAHRDVRFVDVGALAEDAVWVAEVSAGDAFHPSTAGYGRLAAIVAPVVTDWLAELASREAAQWSPARNGRDR